MVVASQESRRRRPGTPPSIRIVQVSTSARVAAVADIRRSATWLTNSSRRRWCKQDAFAGGLGGHLAEKTAEGPTMENSRWDQTRPWRATSRAPTI